MIKLKVLAIILLMSCGVLSAQTVNTVVHHPKKNNGTSYQPKATANHQAHRGMKSLIWSDDFSNPANWVIGNEVSNNDNWVIGTAGPQGQYAISTIQSTTASNGFALFDSDFMCSGNEIGDITNVNSIDCSGHPYVQLTFQQQYRRFVDSTFVFVSNDDVNWTIYPVNVNLDPNDYCKSNPDTVNVNISATAGNYTTVWIRFQFYSPSTLAAGAGCGYSWMIDDVSITDLDSSDIAVGKPYFAYTQIPVGEQLPITMGAQVYNVGGIVQTNVLLNATVNSTFFTGTSGTFASTNPMELDTLYISSPFTPGGLGAYSINFTAQQTETDENPANNSNSGTLMVTDSTFAMDNNIYNPLLASLDNGNSAGNFNPFEVGNMFQVTSNNYVTSITFVADSINSSAGAVVDVNLYSVSSDTTSYTITLITTSAAYTLLATDLPSPGANPTSVTVLFNSPIAVAPGFYLATVGFTGGLAPFSCAASQDQIVNDSNTWFYDGVQFMWFTNDRIPLVRLNMNVTAGINSITAANGVKLFQNEPNPFNDLSIISYQLPNEAIVSLTISDMLGRTIMNIDQGQKSAGMHNITIDGNSLSKGVYFYKLMVDGISLTKKMVITE